MDANDALGQELANSQENNDVDEDVEVAEEEKVDETPWPSGIVLQGMTAPQLRALCGNKGLPSTGSKAEMRTRINAVQTANAIRTATDQMCAAIAEEMKQHVASALLTQTTQTASAEHTTTQTYIGTVVETAAEKTQRLLVQKEMDDLAKQRSLSSAGSKRKRGAMEDEDLAGTDLDAKVWNQLIKHYSYLSPLQSIQFQL